MARYILARITEDFGIGLTFDSKPIKGDIKKRGCYTKFSTVTTPENISNTNQEPIQSVILPSLKMVKKQDIGPFDEDLSTDSDCSENKPKIDSTEGDSNPTSIDPYVASSIACSENLGECRGIEALKDHFEVWLQDI